MSVLEKFIHQIHEYERSKDNKDIYRCVHPKCTHYQRRSLLVGKQASCAKCHDTFILTWRDLRAKKPVCEFCHASPKSQELRKQRDAAFAALNELPEEFKQSLLDKTLE